MAVAADAATALISCCATIATSPPPPTPHRACNNVPCECTFFQHVSLAPGATAVNVSATIVIDRSDHTDYGGHGQELPASYGIGDLSQLVSYIGDAPFTGAWCGWRLHPSSDQTRRWGWGWSLSLMTDCCCALVSQTSHCSCDIIAQARL